MLPRKHKVERSAFSGILKTGRRFSTAHTSLTLTKGGLRRRLSFVISKAVAPQAHDRNRLKRLGNSVAKRLIDFEGGNSFQAVCFFKKGSGALTVASLTAELTELFTLSGIGNRN